MLIIFGNFSMFLVSGEKRSVYSGTKKRFPREIGLGTFFSSFLDPLVPLLNYCNLLLFKFKYWHSGRVFL